MDACTISRPQEMFSTVELKHMEKLNLLQMPEMMIFTFITELKMPAGTISTGTYTN